MVGNQKSEIGEGRWEIFDFGLRIADGGGDYDYEHDYEHERERGGQGDEKIVGRDSAHPSRLIGDHDHD
jgi:hypothetical protein